MTDNLGKVTHLRYDAQGNTLSVTDALGNETDMTYDIRNAPLQTTLPATGQTGSGHSGSQTTYLYAEPSSCLTTQWRSAAALVYGPAVTQTSYDEGNVGAIRQVNTTYGLEGETLTVTGSTEPVTYAYDALYRLSTLTDAASHVTSYFYNPAGYLYQVAYPGAGAAGSPLSAGHADTVTFSSYDADGNILSRTDGNAKTTTYAYSDPESLLTAITYPTGTIGNVSLGYDTYGRETSMSDGTGSQSLSYDDDGYVLTQTTSYTGAPTKTQTYTYWPCGRRASLTLSGLSTSFNYGYDAVGRMNSITNPNSETSSWTYYDNDWMKTQTLGNGAVTTYTRNALGQIASLLNQNNAATTLSSFSSLVYDGIGNRVSIPASIPSTPSSYSGTTGYSYDYGQTANAQLNRSQLTQETSTRNGGYTRTYGYDGNTSTGPGNPSSFKGTTNTFNSDNQLTNTGYSYDGNGNPTTYRTGTLTFDPENRLTAYGSLMTAGYSNTGLRAWKQNSAGKTYFLYDCWGLPLAEYTTSGTLTALDTFGANGLLSRNNTSGTKFYQFDPSGNPVYTLNTSNVISAPRLFDAYGTLLAGTPASDEVYGDFGGQWGYYQDAETGLQLLTQRYYDASTGCFLSRDPSGYAGGANLYAYTRNNPVNQIDPFGLWPTAPYGGTTSTWIGDYGFHCGPHVFSPYMGVEDCIDQACYAHDTCTNLPVCRGTFNPIMPIARRLCDYALCARAIGCLGGCRLSFPCQLEAWLIRNWFCSGPGSGPYNNGTPLPPGAVNLRGGPP